MFVSESSQLERTNQCASNRGEHIHMCMTVFLSCTSKGKGENIYISFKASVFLMVFLLSLAGICTCEFLLKCFYVSFMHNPPCLERTWTCHGPPISVYWPPCRSSASRKDTDSLFHHVSWRSSALKGHLSAKNHICKWKDSSPSRFWPISVCKPHWVLVNMSHALIAAFLAT